ncbi:hypothetical protein CC80DRAFT_550960 [Byssothecium circinans]|uniref:Uncharacterized protein n=1 Tax=Byssothecium circinans TaxID=147558 RepID=A0A6A5TP83_9PLEO|nr:hypothetical protein CC80DRAFT_550960 [Byssothecium circinans]
MSNSANNSSASSSSQAAGSQGPQSSTNDASPASGPPAPAVTTNPHGPALHPSITDRPLVPGLYGVNLAALTAPRPLRETVDYLMSVDNWVRAPGNQPGTITIYLGQAVNIVGSERFELNSAGRLVLREDDELCRQGAELGVPEEVMQWLKRGDEMITLSETLFR